MRSKPNRRIRSAYRNRWAVARRRREKAGQLASGERQTYFGWYSGTPAVGEQEGVK
jgi:hypothetical protein